MINDKAYNLEKNEIDDEISKTKAKQEALEITKIAETFLSLKPKQIKQLDLDDSIVYEILKGQTMQRIARKRQTQYIGKLLRNTDTNKVRAIHQQIVQPDVSQVALMHQLENIRDKLIDHDVSQQTLTEVINRFPDIDSQNLRLCIRNHHKELIQNKPLKSYKLIFKILKESINI